MRKYKYVGVFANGEGHKYKLSVSCDSFFQAFFLLTADAIRTGKHYQLYCIIDKKSKVKFVDDILKVGDLIN